MSWSSARQTLLSLLNARLKGVTTSLGCLEMNDFGDARNPFRGSSRTRANIRVTPGGGACAAPACQNRVFAGPAIAADRH